MVVYPVEHGDRADHRRSEIRHGGVDGCLRRPAVHRGRADGGGVEIPGRAEILARTLVVGRGMVLGRGHQVARHLADDRRIEISGRVEILDRALVVGGGVMLGRGLLLGRWFVLPLGLHGPGNGRGGRGVGEGVGDGAGVDLLSRRRHGPFPVGPGLQGGVG